MLLAKKKTNTYFMLWIVLSLIFLSVLYMIYYIDKNYGSYLNLPKLQMSSIQIIFNEEIQRRSDADLWINENPIYSGFKIKDSKKKKHVSVLIIVSTAPKRFDRRQAIRETWWKDCRSSTKITPECIFMTDHQKRTSKYYDDIKNEQSKYGDLRFQHLQSGINFGMRYLYHLVYSVKNYDFDYLLRMDDDYFFCLNSFLQELPIPALQNFHWGWVHCIERIVRPEESMLLFSRDIVMKFLKQDPQKIKCHPWADQMIGEWTNDLNMTNIFRHDSRLHHHPPVNDELRNMSNICSQFIGVHGCYPSDMKLLWKHKGNSLSTHKTLEMNSAVCSLTSGFRWQDFKNEWRYQPKLCIDNPLWNTSKQTVKNGSYSGRENS